MRLRRPYRHAFTFNIQLYIMDQRVSTTLRILSLTTVPGLMHALFNGYNVKQSSLESTSNLKTILSMYKVLPVSTFVLYFPSYRWHRSVSNKRTGNRFELKDVNYI